MNKLFFSSIALLAVFFMSGCIPRSLEPCAKEIIVMPEHPEILKTCRFLKEIQGNNIHGESTPFFSDEKLELDDINFLKNETAKLGGNVVVFKEHQIITTPHRSNKPKRRYYSESKHNILGKAYLCPQEVTSQLWRWTIKERYSY